MFFLRPDALYNYVDVLNPKFHTNLPFAHNLTETDPEV